MLKSNHVQQNTAAYVKLSGGHQHMPEKCLADYRWAVEIGWQLSSTKPLKTTCKWAAVRWWALPCFRGRSRYSAEWQFTSMKHISFGKTGKLGSLVCLPQLSQLGYFTAHECGMVLCTAIGNVQTITQEQSADLSWCLFIFSQSFYAEK